MRKSMKTVKVYTIRKILKQIRLWQKKKNKEKNEKIEKKIERLKKEVDIIKKLNIDSVSSIALKETKQWNTILNQKNASVEERSFARLISHKKIQEKLSQFYSQNPELKSFIPLVLEKWERRKLSKLEKLKNNHNLEEKDENNMDIANQKNESKKEKLVDKMDSKELINKQINPKKEKIKKMPKISESDDDSASNSISDTIKNIPMKQLSKKIEEIPDKVEGSLHILQIDLDKLKEDENIKLNPISQESVNKPFLPEKRMRDSFFSLDNESDLNHSDSENTSDDSISDSVNSNLPKLKTQFISSLSSHNKRKSFPNKINSFNKQDYKKSLFRKESKRQNKISKRPEKNFNESMKKEDPKSYIKNVKCDLSYFNKSKRKDSEQDSSLHPSWEAKKKQKTNILPFQGKKITFNAND